MKKLLILALCLTLLSACTPLESPPAPIDIVAVPPGQQTNSTPTVKVVEMATQTPAAANEAVKPTETPAYPAPTEATPTGAESVQPKSLTDMRIAFKTYEDKFAGVAFDYPESWLISDPGDDSGKQMAMVYTVSLRSNEVTRGPKQSEGIPPGMTAVDVSFTKPGADGAWTLEKAVANRKSMISTNESGQPVKIAEEADWTLANGIKAHYILINGGPDPLGGYPNDRYFVEMVTVVRGYMVLFSGTGDTQMVSAVAASLRELQ